MTLRTESVWSTGFKSSNVILVPSEHSPGEVRAVITDFGLAHGLVPSEISLTGSQEMVGTPAYMAPEQLSGGAITPATDIYALGIVMFEMLTGAVPFNADNPLSTALKRLSESAPSPRAYGQHPAGYGAKEDARWVARVQGTDRPF